MKTRNLVSTSVAAVLSVASFGLCAGDYSAGASSAGAEHGAAQPAVYRPQGFQATAGEYSKGGFVKVASHSKQKDIVDVAVSAGSFDTLVTAVKAADLASTLKGEGPFTVFAPTDEAFAKIPEDQLTALLKDKEALTAVLTYHVVPGKVTAAEVMKLSSAKTVEGQSLTIDTSEGVKVDGANVIKTDVMASNGVIHVIDTVLMPKN